MNTLEEHPLGIGLHVWYKSGEIIAIMFDSNENSWTSFKSVTLLTSNLCVLK